MWPSLDFFSSKSLNHTTFNTCLTFSLQNSKCCHYVLFWSIFLFDNIKNLNVNAYKMQLYAIQIPIISHKNYAVFINVLVKVFIFGFN